MIKKTLIEQLNVNLPAEDFYVTCKGRLIADDEIIPGQKYLLVPRLVGGKGGFGSMLRAIGAQIEKTTNREACRDLRGRRMRDVNNEKKLREWGEKIGEREREKIERRRLKRERIKNRGLLHKFEDQKYNEQKELVKQNMEEALQHALSKGGKAVDKGKLKKREITMVFGQETSDFSSDSEMEEQNRKIRKVDNCLKSSIIECTITDGSSSFDMITSTHDQFNIGGTSTTQDMIAQDPVCCKSTTLTLEMKEISLISPESIDGTFSNTQNMTTLGNNQVMDTQNMNTNGSTHVMNTENMITNVCNQDIYTQNMNTLGSNQIMETQNMNTIGSTQVMNTQIGDTVEMKAIDTEVSPSTQQNVMELDMKSQSNVNNVNTCKDKEIIDLSNYEDATSLETLGLDELKRQLMMRGIKCGGTLTERAVRLYSIKGLESNQIPANLLAKGNKK